MKCERSNTFCCNKHFEEFCTSMTFELLIYFENYFLGVGGLDIIVPYGIMLMQNRMYVGLFDTYLGWKHERPMHMRDTNGFTRPNAYSWISGKRHPVLCNWDKSIFTYFIFFCLPLHKLMVLIAHMTCLSISDTKHAIIIIIGNVLLFVK